MNYCCWRHGSCKGAVLLPCRSGFAAGAIANVDRVHYSLVNHASFVRVVERPKAHTPAATADERQLAAR